MEKIKELFAKYKPFIIACSKSRGMQGIAAAAVGTVISYAKAHLPAPVLDVAGELITYAAASLQIGGLGWAVNGRLNAAGPIKVSAELGVRSAEFDGTAGDLPK